MRTALIDGDILAYKASNVSQNEIDWDSDGDSVTQLTPQQAAKAIKTMVSHWTDAANCQDYRIFISAPRSWRTMIYPQYKMNRKDFVKPELLGFCIEYMIEELRAIKAKFPIGLEADDMIGITHTNPDTDTVAISTDKDFRTLFGDVMIIPHYLDKRNPQVEHISFEKADDHWFEQAILGDNIDNYKGAPGIGGRWLANLGERPLQVDDVFHAFNVAWSKKKKYHHLWTYPGDTEQEAIMNLRLSRILRHGDYKEGEITLYTPAGYPLETETLNLRSAA